jgi:hypothetical protein
MATRRTLKRRRQRQARRAAVLAKIEAERRAFHEKYAPRFAAAHTLDQQLKVYAEAMLGEMIEHETRSVLWEILERR